MPSRPTWSASRPSIAVTRQRRTESAARSALPPSARHLLYVHASNLRALDATLLTAGEQTKARISRKFSCQTVDLGLRRCQAGVRLAAQWFHRGYPVGQCEFGDHDVGVHASGSPVLGTAAKPYYPQSLSPCWTAATSVILASTGSVTRLPSSTFSNSAPGSIRCCAASTTAPATSRAGWDASSGVNRISRSSSALWRSHRSSR